MQMRFDYWCMRRRSDNNNDKKPVCGASYVRSTMVHIYLYGQRKMGFTGLNMRFMPLCSTESKGKKSYPANTDLTKPLIYQTSPSCPVTTSPNRWVIKPRQAVQWQPQQTAELSQLATLSSVTITKPLSYQILLDCPITTLKNRRITKPDQSVNDCDNEISF